MQQLRNNKQIVINKADKGSTVVIVNRDDYIENGLKHLDNPSVYRTCIECPRLIVANSTHVRKLTYNTMIPDEFPALMCTSKCVVYVIKCKVHHKAYVGQTIHMVKSRVSQQLAMVKRLKHGVRMNMGHHFNGCDCSIDNWVWAPVAKVDERLPKREAEAQLKEPETLWNRKMCSMQPWGMSYVEIDTEVRAN